jgi:hypothetical protein
MSGPAGAWSDDEMLARLGELMDRSDPMPADVVAQARPLFLLRRLDEQLVELIRDSADDRESDRVLAVRGQGDVRLISFETGPVTVELQVTEQGTTRDLVAQITGTAVVRAEVETSGGRQQVHVDDGLFSTDGVQNGLLRLRLLTEGGRELVTSWVKV